MQNLILPRTKEEIIVWKLEHAASKKSIRSTYMWTNNRCLQSEYNRLNKTIINWIGFIFLKWPDQVSLFEVVDEGVVKVKCFDVYIGSFDLIDLVQVMNPTCKIKRIFD